MYEAEAKLLRTGNERARQRWIRPSSTVALILFLVVILFRPEGLLGKAEERKV